MATIIIQLDPRWLDNPDADMRYKLPDLLVARSGGGLSDDGYDYVGHGSDKHLMLYLRSDDPDAALPTVIETLKSERVLDNDLSSVPIAVENGDSFRVVHPPGFVGEFRRSDRI